MVEICGIGVETLQPVYSSATTAAVGVGAPALVVAHSASPLLDSGLQPKPPVGHCEDELLHLDHESVVVHVRRHYSRQQLLQHTSVNQHHKIDLIFNFVLQTLGSAGAAPVFMK